MDRTARPSLGSCDLAQAEASVTPAVRSRSPFGSVLRTDQERRCHSCRLRFRVLTIAVATVRGAAAGPLGRPGPMPQSQSTPTRSQIRSLLLLLCRSEASPNCPALLAASMPFPHSALSCPRSNSTLRRSPSRQPAGASSPGPSRMIPSITRQYFQGFCPVPTARAPYSINEPLPMASRSRMWQPSRTLEGRLLRGLNLQHHGTKASVCVNELFHGSSHICQGLAGVS